MSAALIVSGWWAPALAGVSVGIRPLRKHGWVDVKDFFSALVIPGNIRGLMTAGRRQRNKKSPGL
jgi:hypothetical protein